MSLSFSLSLLFSLAFALALSLLVRNLTVHLRSPYKSEQRSLTIYLTSVHRYIQKNWKYFIICLKKKRYRFKLELKEIFCSFIGMWKCWQKNILLYVNDFVNAFYKTKNIALIRFCISCFNIPHFQLLL